MKLGQLTDEDVGSEEPNLTPLIDIVFILLIFFLVTTTFAKELGVSVDRPHAQSATAQTGEIVRVAVSRQGAITVDGQPTSAFRVEAEVRAKMGTKSQSVLLVADKAVDAETLVQLMDACRQGGAKNVALAVDPL